MPFVPSRPYKPDLCVACGACSGFQPRSEVFKACSCLLLMHAGSFLNAWFVHLRPSRVRSGSNQDSAASAGARKSLVAVIRGPHIDGTLLSGVTAVSGLWIQPARNWSLAAVKDGLRYKFLHVIPSVITCMQPLGSEGLPCGCWFGGLLGGPGHSLLILIYSRSIKHLKYTSKW